MRKKNAARVSSKFKQKSVVRNIAVHIFTQGKDNKAKTKRPSDFEVETTTWNIKIAFLCGTNISRKVSIRDKIVPSQVNTPSSL